MDHPDQLAVAILDLFYEAHKLIGIEAILTDGTAGTIAFAMRTAACGAKLILRGLMSVSGHERRPLR
jgi:hypothetical protein